MKQPLSEIEDFYQNKYNENDRMARNPIEFMRCMEIISRFLQKENMEIADIGGATGVFSYWLKEQGHSVHLLDFTARHIDQAKENGRKKGISLASYTCGDARKTPYAHGQFDLILEMGPLYHLQGSNDRLMCLKEARRVLKNDGVVICEAISRYANIFDGHKFGFMDDEKFVRILDENLLTGKHTPGDTPYFTTAFFHTPCLMKNELEQAGFSDIKLIAVEGFASAINTDTITTDDKRMQLMLKYIRNTESVPELLGVSSHFIATGVKRAK